jgi:hypothetical protein
LDYSLEHANTSEDAWDFATESNSSEQRMWDKLEDLSLRPCNFQENIKYWNNMTDLPTNLEEIYLMTAVAANRTMETWYKLGHLHGNTVQHIQEGSTCVITKVAETHTATIQKLAQLQQWLTNLEATSGLTSHAMQSGQQLTHLKLESLGLCLKENTIKMELMFAALTSNHKEDCKAAQTQHKHVQKSVDLASPPLDNQEQTFQLMFLQLLTLIQDV